MITSRDGKRRRPALAKLTPTRSREKGRSSGSIGTTLRLLYLHQYLLYLLLYLLYLLLLYLLLYLFLYLLLVSRFSGPRGDYLKRMTWCLVVPMTEATDCLGGGALMAAAANR